MNRQARRKTDRSGNILTRVLGIDEISLKCPVAIGIVARNIQIIGHILPQKEVKRLKRLEKIRRQEKRLVA